MKGNGSENELSKKKKSLLKESDGVTGEVLKIF